MYQYKKSKIYFCFAVLLLVAKPFLGFTMFSRLHPPGEENIFVKVFTKRKQEYSEDSSFNLSTIHEKLANPGLILGLRFCHFLDILFPGLFRIASAKKADPRSCSTSVLPFGPDPYVLNRALLI